MSQATKWVVGYASEKWQRESGAWYDTHIGGEPIWPDSLLLQIDPCPRCGLPRRLVLQAYAPHQYHQQRAIYVFGCNSIICSSDPSSWYSLRVCRVRDDTLNDNCSVPSRSAQNASGDVEIGSLKAEQAGIDWDADSETESDSLVDDLADDLDLLILEAQLARAKKEAAVGKGSKSTVHSPLRVRNDGTGSLAHTTDKRPRHDDGLNDARLPKVPIGGGTLSVPSVEKMVFESFYIEVDYEPETSKQNAQETPVKLLIHRYEEEERLRTAQGTPESWAAEQEEDESQEVRSFERFQKRIARAPGHVLRYLLGGEPIWPCFPYPKLDPDTTCTCGAPMEFEVQLLGSSLHYLKPDLSIPSQQKEAGMNFASIAMFTCAADCTEADVVSENQFFKAFRQTVLVQQDDW